MFKSSMIYFLIVFTPSLIVGLWQLFDDNFLKEKYEKKLSKEEIENKILKKTNLPKNALDIFDTQFQCWCGSWEKNDMSLCSTFSEAKYHEINKLQIEGFIDTNQTRHVEISKNHDISFLNINSSYTPKVYITKKQRDKVKKDAPIRLRLKFEGEIADYQTEKGENGTENFVIGNRIPYEQNIVLDYYLINKEHPERIESWKFIGTKKYDDFMKMRDKKYPKGIDKFLKRNNEFLNLLKKEVISNE